MLCVVFRAIERVHHLRQPVARSTSRRHRRPGQSRLQSRAVRPARTWPARGRPDRAARLRGPRRCGAAHSRSCRVLGDRSQPVVPALRSARPRAQPPQRQVHVVAHDQQVRQRRSCRTAHSRRPPAPLRFMNVSGLTSSTTSSGRRHSRLRARRPAQLRTASADAAAASRSTTSNPTLCRVPRYSSAGIAEAGDQLHAASRPTSSSSSASRPCPS